LIIRVLPLPEAQRKATLPGHLKVIVLLFALKKRNHPSRYVLAFVPPIPDPGYQQCRKGLPQDSLIPSQFLGYPTEGAKSCHPISTLSVQVFCFSNRQHWDPNEAATLVYL
jgi:hypothetical protein